MSKKSHHFLTLWPWPLTYDLEKLIRSGHYHYQCVYQIWEQSIPWFLSFCGRRGAGDGRLWRKTITSPDPSDTGDIIIYILQFTNKTHNSCGQSSKLLPVRLPEADNFGGGPGTFLDFLQFYVYDLRFKQDWKFFDRVLNTDMANEAKYCTNFVINTDYYDWLTDWLTDILFNIIFNSVSLLSTSSTRMSHIPLEKLKETVDQIMINWNSYLSPNTEKESKQQKHISKKEDSDFNSVITLPKAVVPK